MKKLTLLFLLYFFIEGLCLISLWLLKHKFHISYNPILQTLTESQETSIRKFLEAKTGQHYSQNSVLGWVHFEESNSAGMRDRREYHTSPKKNSIRMSAFGDSFTYGQDVDLEDTWEKQLMAMDSSIEVLNYGVPAYGLDQAYLRYIEIGTEYNPHIVFLGYMSENIARNVNVFRPFYSHLYQNAIFTKPRFKIRDEELILIKNPLSSIKDYEHLLFNDSEVMAKLGENDYYYNMRYLEGRFDFLPSIRFAKILLNTLSRKTSISIYRHDGYYNIESEAFKITTHIFDAFYHDVLENGALPVILIYPDLNDQIRSRDKKERRYTPLLDYFRSKDYYYIDLLDALEHYESSFTIDDFVEDWGHFSPLGNMIIAEFIYKKLNNRGLTNISKLRETIQTRSTQFNITSGR